MMLPIRFVNCLYSFEKQKLSLYRVKWPISSHKMMQITTQNDLKHNAFSFITQKEISHFA